MTVGKAAFSGVFEHKFVLLYTLLHRSFSIYSSYEKCHKEIVLLKDIFKKNEYSQFFINNCIKNYLSKLFVSKRVIHTVDKNKSC